MFFTQEDYRKIEKWLLANSIKDTDFVGAATPLKGNETLAFVQDGKNVNVFLKDLIEQIFLLGVSDFLNVSDKYGESIISLTQAIQLIPFRSRKIGQVITFLDEEGHWKLYQFQGKSLNQWNNSTLWIDLLAKISGIPIIDSEDIITKVDDAKQVSLYLADKQYNEADYSGLGRVYLRKNIQTIIDPSTGKVINVNLLTQSMLVKENTIYILQYDYNLNNQTISIPEGSVLLFEGGSIDNGAINCNGTTIVNKFSGNATIVGTYSFQDAQADEEDITQNQSSVLKFKDRKYEPDKYSGLGRKILRRRVIEIEDPVYGTQEKNLLLQEDFDDDNTVYVVRYDFTLNGQDIILPDNSYIEYEGGSISDGNIIDKAGGFNRVILKKNILNDKNILTKDMVSKPNTIYEIRYDFDLNGQEITIPEGCTLDFQGGSIINGTVVFNKTNIIEPSSTIFKNIVLNGTIENQYINIGWFKDVADYSNLIENLLKIGNIYFPNGTYKFSTIVKIDTDDRIIAGNNIENTIITAIDSNPLNFLSVRANNISIKNLSFIDNPEGYPSKGTAQGARASYEIEVRENATNTIISNCSFKQATGGIFAYQGAVGLQIINCIFEDMVYIPRDINNLPLGGAGGYGVVCHFDGDNNHNIGVKDVLIKNNTFKDTIYRHAIYIQNVYNCIVEDNTSYHTNEEKASGYESHMMYYGGQGVNIVNNYFYGGCGALTTSADAEGNNASFFTFSNNHIIDWQCYKSGNGGIALGNMSNCIISNNVFNSAYKCAAIKISKNCDFVKIINNSINTGNEAPTGIAQLAPISSDSGFPTLKNIDIINNTITTQHAYCCYFRFINSSNVLTDGIRNIKITNNTLSSTNTGITIRNSNIFSNILISGNTFLMPTPLSLFEVNSPSTGKEGIILANNYWENGNFVSKLGDYLYILVINNIIGKGGNNDDYVGRMLLPSGNHLIPAKGNYLGPEIVPGVKCDYGDVIINRTTTRQAPVMWMCISGGIAGTDNVRFIPIYGKLYGTTNERESIDFSTLSSQEKSDLSLGMIYFDSDLRKPVVYNGSYWTYFDGWNVEYLRSGTTAQRPILNANQVPFQYYDTDLKKFINWNGTAWVNLDGTALI